MHLVMYNIPPHIKSSKYKEFLLTPCKDDCSMSSCMQSKYIFYIRGIFGS